MFTKIQDGRWNTLKVQLVQTTYCRPQLEQCRCKSLLESLLDRETTINKITGDFTAKPYIAGCKCYLGAAARKGFAFLKMENPASRKECKGKRDFTVDDYEDLCLELQNFNCRGPVEMTKMDPDVE